MTAGAGLRARRAWLALAAAAVGEASVGPRAVAAAASTPEKDPAPNPAPNPGTTPAAPPRTAPRPGDDASAGVRRGRTLAFPRDHGAHPDTRTEWWYVTGWLADAVAASGPSPQPSHGFQVTFFRSRHDRGGSASGRFAARHVLFAHAAVTDLAARTHRHDQRIARWNGDPAARPDFAALDDAAVHVGGWSIGRSADDRWRSRIRGSAVTLEFEAAPTQPLLLQGDAGFSRKGPDERQASHYVSVPQLAVRAAVGGRPLEGRAWLDHEWSEELLHPDAVGWDWIGLNLFDGSALTAFVLRRADGSTLWAGGSWRAAGAPARAFAADAVRFEPGRRWRSPATNASYPVQWQVHTPAGRFELRSLLDGQELDGRGGTGAVYWEGIAEGLDAAGRRIGLGYLEMTGYAARLRLG